ncbi:Smr/MutS family protein [Candidatus Mesenet endosymbiont of Agriotes lineatus]|uniref:Smr/MutS family protein n=1 Tax=Candidatus Mesenet endosymbiont of Agriotes lineatus TaxID=3077948 RepID=UPI0030D3CAE2
MQDDDKFDFSLWCSVIKNITPITNNKILPIKKKLVAFNSHNNVNYYLNNKFDFIKEEKLKSYDIDHNTKIKVIKGKYALDDQLDLHGYSLDKAYSILLNFITEHYHVGSRCLLIITGYGNQINTGVIKNNFANWLNSSEIQHMILYYTQATKIHGGKGAFYVLLRRIRTKHK